MTTAKAQTIHETVNKNISGTSSELDAYIELNFL